MNRLLKSFLLTIAAFIVMVLEVLILNIIEYLFGDVAYIIVAGAFLFGVLWWLFYSTTKR